MSKLNCEITVFENTGHVQQILTGYFLLKQQGMINLTCKMKKVKFNDLNKSQHIRDAKKYHAKVIIDKQIKIYYDLHDSYEICELELSTVDVYFKRSFSNKYLKTLDASISSKVFALGLNYWVYPNKFDIDNLKRSIFFLKGINGASSLMRALNLPSSLTNAPKLNDIENFPLWKNKEDKKILFMARTWDPYDNKDRSIEKIEERKEINETRASCIRALKKEFGRNFSGGFSPTEHSLRYYKDCIFPNSSLTTKNKYLEFLKSHSICIASTGLHGSIGWKFGEYVAMSKAIVSEKIIYSVPGPFEKNKNYLEFITPFECVEQTFSLYNDDEKRYKMMTRNAEYYYQYLKPDALVYNTILKALLFRYENLKGNK